MNVNSGRRRKRHLRPSVFHSSAITNVNTLSSHHWKLTKASSGDSHNKIHLMSFSTCIKTMPFLKDLSGDNNLLQALSRLIDDLKSTNIDILSPSGLLECYHRYCSCTVN